MRAVALHDVGSAPTLTELPVREPGAGELLVRVAASSVNGFDIAVTEGWIREFMEYRFPVVLGKDFAGTVEATGPDVSRFAVGDEGYGVARRPPALDTETAGALGLAGSAAATALEALALKEGQTLLISGATGG